LVPLQAEAERLAGEISEMQAEIDSLRDTVAHLGESLTNALNEGAGADAQKGESGGWAGRMGRA